ncbi:MAG: hypothetical protein H6621_10970 [Halobacteriovoraceae bacterium]|nr:hypothetical protein [Halobacteriovoraceae bacterium]MCB9095579.1 hypothetical protein [Halobacteriovoraceae bacterium]
MKHLILKDSNLTLDSAINSYPELKDHFMVQDCDFSHLEKLSISKSFDGGVIVALSSWKSYKLEILREKFPSKKITLICPNVAQENVKELQLRKKAIDLFFAPLMDFQNYQSMYEALTTEVTASATIEFSTAEINDGGDLEIENGGRDDDNIKEAIASVQEGKQDFGDDELAIENGGRDDIADDDEENQAHHSSGMTSSSIDLAKELEGIDGGILGVDNVSYADGEEESDLSELLEGSGEEDGALDSHDISRILKSEVLLSELNKSKNNASSEQTSPSIKRNAEALKNEAKKEPEVPKVEEAKEIAAVEKAPAPKVEAPKREEVQEPVRATPKVEIQKDIPTQEDVTTPSRVHVSTDEHESQVYAQSNVQNLIHFKESELIKVISRNEMLEEENRILREKVVTLEEVASSASMLSHQKSLESDESRIRASILKKRHNEEKENILQQVRYLEEKLHYMEEKAKHLQDENKSLAKKNIFDVKKVKAREEELEEKIELMKTDITMQIKNRENKIIELKRKIDLLQFDLKDSEEREKDLGKRITNLENKLYQLKKILGESIERLDDSETPVLKFKI